MPRIGNEARLIHLLAKERVNDVLSRFGLPLLQEANDQPDEPPDEPAEEWVRWAAMSDYYLILEKIIAELEGTGVEA